VRDRRREGERERDKEREREEGNDHNRVEDMGNHRKWPMGTVAVGQMNAMRMDLPT
jgi:hypothetical protein